MTCNCSLSDCFHNPRGVLQSKFDSLVQRKRTGGLVFNDTLRNHKGYRNPDLLTKLVEHWKVEQYGSAFDKEAFDPAGLPEEDKIGKRNWCSPYELLSASCLAVH
jgi:HCNGP-like protein